MSISGFVLLVQYNMDDMGLGKTVKVMKFILKRKKLLFETF